MIRFAVPAWLALTLTSPLVGQGTGSTRDIVAASFANTPSGSFPADVSRVSGSLEVVERNGVRMLRASTASEFPVNLPEILPENFTLEFDLIPKKCCSADELAFEGTPSLSESSSSAHVFWGRQQQRVKGGDLAPFYASVPGRLAETLAGQLTRIVATFEGTTLKMYTNGERLYTVDRRFVRGRVLRVFLGGEDEEKAVYLARLRIAEGIGTPTVNAVMASSAGTGMLSASTQPASGSGVTAVTTTTGQTATATPIDAATAGIYAPSEVEVVFSSETSATVTWKDPAQVPQGYLAEDGTWVVAWNEQSNDAVCATLLANPDRIKCPYFYWNMWGVDPKRATLTLRAGGRYVVRVWMLYDDVQYSSSPVPAVYNSLAEGPLSRGLLSTMSSGPVPVLAPITGDQGMAKVRWTAPAGTVNYVVMRRVGNNAPEQRTLGPLSVSAFDDQIPDARVTYQYQVLAYQVDGTYGVSEWAPYTPPPLINPAGFAVRQIGTGEAQLTWQSVPNAASYRIDGPGLPLTGSQVKETYLDVAGLPAGSQLTWQVAAIFGSNQMDLTTRPTATATLTSIWRSVPWLTMRNGTGTSGDQLAYYTAMIKRPADCTAIYPWDCLKALDLILNFPVDNAFRAQLGLGPRTPDGAPVSEAKFADLRDMGAGRHVMCSEHRPFVPPPPGAPTMETLCWASTHGPYPGTAGWGDAETELAAVVGGNPNRGWTFITTGSNGPLFTAFEGQAGSTGQYGESQYGKVKLESVFDVEGAKKLPHACLACHGGRYDASVNRVVNASLIPLDPSILVFPTQAGLTRQDQEEGIRRINMIVLNSNPSPAVAAYIRGLYGGPPDVPGTRANDNYVPAGWVQAPELYKKIVKPYCQGCHLQQQPRIDFATYDNFATFKASIATAVCTTHTMPHGEAPLLAFWRDGRGLPDYLMTALGLDKCPK